MEEVCYSTPLRLVSLTLQAYGVESARRDGVHHPVSEPPRCYFFSPRQRGRMPILPGKLSSCQWRRSSSRAWLLPSCTFGQRYNVPRSQATRPRRPHHQSIPRMGMHYSLPSDRTCLQPSLRRIRVLHLPRPVPAVVEPEPAP